MLNRDDAVLVSEAIDDSRPLPAEAGESLRAEFVRQRRVDTLLRGSAAAVSHPSPLGLVDRIRAAVAETEPDHLVAGRIAFGPFAAAAAAVLLVGLSLYTTLPKTSSGSRLRGNAMRIIPIPSDPAAALGGTIESPLEAEARNLKEDTRRAADAVLAFLPISR
ncbi:MAG: hypothetical protein ACOYN0_02660 [Phycisphaerales bacterium]